MKYIKKFIEGCFINDFLFVKEVEKIKGRRRGIFVCRLCNKEFISRVEDISSGNTKSCGCLNIQRIKERSTTHGLAKKGLVVPEFNVWWKMIERCEKSNTKEYKYYGARGIRVCERWRKSKVGFENFYKDMGPRPSNKHSIERKNVNGIYEPTNCKWETRVNQMRNRTDTYYVEFGGKIKCFSEWCELLGLKPQLSYQRINRDKWSIEKTFSYATKDFSHIFKDPDCRFSFGHIK